jgi:prolipoprotein diacylglyceryl transferase
MIQFAVITWTFNPEIFSTEIFGFEFAPRWYGLCFALAFLIGYFIAERMWKSEGLETKKLDSLLLAMVAGAIIGARLGHVFFYEWSYYQNHLWEIPNVRQGGLASHGGLIGIVLALWLWARFIGKKPVLWVMDRMAVPTALGGVLIRLGNLFNHEIVGNVTDVPWAFSFALYEDQLPRHPVQIYESLANLGLFILLYYLYFKKKMHTKLGALSGVFLAVMFSARFILEFFKENQILREENMTLNMGHWLSVPVVLVGLYLIFRKTQTTDLTKK